MNVQNLPRDDRTVKRAFIHKRGAFSEFDYSQIEPRLFAYFVAVGLKDTAFVDVYREGRDVYTEIAARALGKRYEDVTPAERQDGKVWFLMSLYGAGPKKVALELGIPYAEALKFYKDFHAGLPQIRALSNPPPKTYRSDYSPGLIERAIRRKGYLKTPWGRHLHVPEFGAHKMLNTLIQGSAADLMKVSLIRVDEWIRESGVESRMIATIHDSIMLDGPVGELARLNEHVPPLMREDFLHDVVPIEVSHDVSTTTWADKIEYGEWLAQHAAQREEITA